MDSSFNMDFILGDSLPRRLKTFSNKIERKETAMTAIISMDDDKEESMLPDSSLSPSNHNLLAYAMDESKLSDMECCMVNKSTDKNEMVADVGVHYRQCRLVTDVTGTEYLVAEEYLMPIIVESCKNVFDNPAQSPSKECTTTTTTNICHDISDSINNKTTMVNYRGQQILDSFLYASHLALVEVKLNDLEKELSILDDYSFSKFVNSAANLKEIPGQTFVSNVTDGYTTSFITSDISEINERDDARRIRLRQIIRKHSELKKWLSKIKKKLKEKNVSKLCHIVDFSAIEHNQLPLPDCMAGRAITPHLISSLDCHDILPGSNIATTYNLQSTRQEKSHLDCLSDLIGYDNSCHSTQKENEGHIHHTESQDETRVETVQDKSSIYEKNIFSQILSLSKDGSDRDSIPLLTYEYESYRDSETRYKHTKCNSDDVSESLNNQNPPTPDLRRAELDCNDISEGIRVLVVQKDYLRAGVINLTNASESDQKLWRVTIDGDRKCQDIVISEWQLLEQGVREVVPTSINQMSPGSRVCANWSVQLPLNLYPGTISLSPLDSYPSLNKLPIDFDDGDHKDVDLYQVRLLPENFPNLHELMKASHIADSNFYSLDRKNRMRKKGVIRLARADVKDECYKESKGIKDSGKGRKRSKKPMDKKKKLVVRWKLIKICETSPAKYELLRNIDNLCIRGGESVQLLSYSRHNFMANVVSVLARHQSSIMEIEFNWYYILSDVQDNSDIIKRLKKTTIAKKVIFKTSHSDVNDVYCVLRKIEVLPFNEYKLKYMRKCNKKPVIPDDCYIMAGRYNETRTRVESLDENIRHYILSAGA